MRTIRRVSAFLAGAVCSSMLAVQNALGGKKSTRTSSTAIKERFLPDTPRSLIQHSTHVSSRSVRLMEDLGEAEINHFRSAYENRVPVAHCANTLFPPSDRLTPTRKAMRRQKKLRYFRRKRVREVRKKKPLAWKT